MVTMYAPHEPDPAHLADVVESMRALGSPEIRALWIGDAWVALEGSHRVAAAAELGVPVVVVPVSEDDEIEHDLGDVHSRRVADLAEYVMSGWPTGHTVEVA
jgi:hypothetical protein